VATRLGGLGRCLVASEEKIDELAKTMKVRFTPTVSSGWPKCTEQ
jgi:hypothetical protein